MEEWERTAKQGEDRWECRRKGEDRGERKERGAERGEGMERGEGRRGEGETKREAEKRAIARKNVRVYYKFYKLVLRGSLRRLLFGM